MANLDLTIPSLKLNDGNAIPLLGYGLGTAWFKRGDESEIDQAAIDATKIALKLKYTHLDGAEVYKTETELGRAIKESGVPREKLFITTKVITNIKDPAAALKASLEKLQLDHVDLYLIHSPFYGKQSAEEYQQTWAVLEGLKEQGLTRSIGVSNFLPEHLDAILQSCRIKPAINQVEFHPYLQHEELLAYHKQHGIATAAFGPLVPITKAESITAGAAEGGVVAAASEPKEGTVDGYLAALAKKYAVNPAEILLRYCIDQDIVAITTSSKEQRLSDYLRCMTFRLTPREIEELNGLGGRRPFRAYGRDNHAPDDFR